MITSRRNARVKAARALRSRRGRARAGLFLVEGIRHVGEALQAGAAVEQVFFAPELLSSEFAARLIEQAGKQGIPCLSVTAEVFASLAEKERPQGILAVVRQGYSRLDSLNPKNFPWGVALLAAQDPGNLGAVLRTVDAVGASGLILLEGGVDIWHPTAVRASMGALFWHPLVSCSFSAFRAWAQTHGYHVYGSSARGGVDYREVDYRRPCVLLLGSEREGLGENELAVCEQVVRLPMEGRVSSLNLAVAAGVLLYELRNRLHP